MNRQDKIVELQKKIKDYEVKIEDKDSDIWRRRTLLAKREQQIEKLKLYLKELHIRYNHKVDTRRDLFAAHAFGVIPWSKTPSGSITARERCELAVRFADELIKQLDEKEVKK